MRNESNDRDYMIALGRRIRDLRKARGLTSFACAMAVGLYSRSELYRYEAGRHVPNCLLFMRFADALGVDLNGLRPTEVEVKATAPIDDVQRLKGRLSRSDRYWLLWVSSRCPGFWTGDEWRLEEILPTQPKPRQRIRRQIMRLESLGHVVYVGNGRFRLNRALQRKPVAG